MSKFYALGRYAEKAASSPGTKPEGSRSGALEAGHVKIIYLDLQPQVERSHVGVVFPNDDRPHNKPITTILATRVKVRRKRKA